MLPAQAIVSTRGGRFPDDVAALRELPGIGPYTAGAIRSIAFGLPAPILDGNVARVFARWFALVGDIDSPDLRRAHVGGGSADGRSAAIQVTRIKP
jgi:A/G-specific adenine glycosylase